MKAAFCLLTVKKRKKHKRFRPGTGSQIYLVTSTLSLLNVHLFENFWAKQPYETAKGLRPAVVLFYSLFESAIRHVTV